MKKIFKYFNFLLASAFLFLSPFFILAITFENPLGKNTTITAILNNVLDYLIYYIAPPIATIMAIYVAFLYMASGGVPEKVQKAHKTLTWLIVGIAVLLLARGIVSTIQTTLQL